MLPRPSISQSLLRAVAKRRFPFRLTTYFHELLRGAGLQCQTLTEWAERAQIINVVVPEAGGLMNMLRDKHGITVNVKDDMLRLSMSFLNTEQDSEKAVDAITRETGKTKA